MCSDPCHYLNDPSVWRVWVESWDSSWIGLGDNKDMLCRNCGQAWSHHGAASMQCPTQNQDETTTFWKPAGRLYDNVYVPDRTDKAWEDYTGELPPVSCAAIAQGSPVKSIRQFETGATRDVDTNKLDFEGFLSPIVLQRFAEYMHKNRVQSNGELRDSDNWQKGIPKSAYMKSGWRHFFAWWRKHRKGEDPTEDLCALLFNVQGYLFELLTRPAVKD